MTHPGKKVDWVHIHNIMPTELTPAAKHKRMQLFDLFDPNKNNYLSLAEVDKGVQDVLHLQELFEVKPVLMMAFKIAKSANQGGGPLKLEAKKNRQTKMGNNYIEKSEFRLLLVYLRQYLELWAMFSEIDVDGDRRVQMAEFQKAVPIIESWGTKIPDVAAEFRSIDKDGAGMILFGEFAEWALNKNLDLPDDDDFDDSTLHAKK